MWNTPNCSHRESSVPIGTACPLTLVLVSADDLHTEHQQLNRGLMNLLLAILFLTGERKGAQRSGVWGRSSMRGKCHWQLILTRESHWSFLSKQTQAKTGQDRPGQDRTGQDSRRCVVSLVNVVSIGGLRPDDTPSDCLRLVLRGVMCCPDLEMNKCRRLPAQTFAAEPESKLTPAFGTLRTYDHLKISADCRARTSLEVYQPTAFRK